MKTLEAISILSIKEPSITLEILKKAYRKACKTYHPDLNKAGTEMMKIVNAAYEHLSKKKFPIEEEETSKVDISEALETALNAIINLEGINIEVCGTWLWISGDTRQYRAVFKEAGFKWSGKKQMWYFRIESEAKKGWRKSFTMEAIRTMHGSTQIKGKSFYKIA